jgi:hypothetical protein
MKTFNQYCLLAAAMLVAGVANAQAPTNTYQGAPLRTVVTPGTAPAAPGDVNTTGPNGNNTKGTYSKNYSDYSQDSYVSQAGNTNYATVDQVNTSGRTALGGTAILDQNGNNNKASQVQSATGATQGGISTYYTGDTRNFMRSTQNGNASQTQQTQANGVANTMTILQGAGTTGNRAIQTQGVDAGGTGFANQAQINQTKYAQGSGTGSGNYAEQVQTGLVQAVKIDQEGSNSYAKQTQRGGANVAAGTNSNDAYIHQGDPGTRNSAEQSQNGLGNRARIQQGIGGTTNDSYAMQTQNGNNNRADIDQHSTTGSYAEQMQSNNNNYSSMTQTNVRSAAYSVQTGAANTAIITQR